MQTTPQPHFWRYLVAVLLPTMLIIPSVVAVLAHLATDEEVVQREQQGLEQIRRLNGAITLLQQVRGTNQMVLQGGSPALMGRLHELEQALSAAWVALRRDSASDIFLTDGDLQQIQGWLGGLIHPVGPHQIPEVVFEKHTGMIDRIVALRRMVMIRSHLALDADLETSFLADLVVSGLPDLEESVGRARGMGSGLLTRPVLSDVARLQFEGRLGGVRTHWEEVRSSRHTILENLPHLSGSLSCLPDQVNPMIQQFLDLSVALFHLQNKTGEADRYFAVGTQTIQTSRVCADMVHTKLLERLERRLDEIQTMQWMAWNGSGAIWAVVTFFVITSYRLNKRAFERVQESEHKHQAIVESAVDGIVTIDERGVIHSANTAAENIFGYENGALIGLNVNVLMPSPDREAHDGYLQAYLASGIKRVVGTTREVMGVCRDGGVFPLEVAVGEFETGDKRFFTGILHDITERKRAKMALQEAYHALEHRVFMRTKELQSANEQLTASLEAQQRAESGLRLAAKVFAHASEAIVITDVSGTIVDVNQAYSQITGFGREEVLGGNPRIGKSGRHDAAFYEEMWRAITTLGQWAGEVWDRRKNGEIYPKWLTINAVKDGNGQTSHFVGIFSDISHIKLTEERLEQLAFFDPLTRLPNRMLFKDRTKRALEWSGRHHKRGAIFFIDLDRFKHVNDTLGHAAGDALLVEVSKRLLACVRASDTVARLGGDEFTVILTDLVRGDEEAVVVAQKIIASVSEPVDLNGHMANIGASIGIAVYPDDGDTYETITQYADVAMYHAKESGRGTYRFFEASMNAKSAKRAIIETNLHVALKEKAFLLHYQPKVHVTSGRIIGMEGLVRWQQADGLLVSPMDFIPLAEETGLIVPLGQHILRLACQYNKSLLDSGVTPLRVAVNLSGRQFQDKSLPPSIQSILEETGLPAEYLELEVTESMMMKDEQQAIAILKQLREIGLTIAMDDFGTGYSSLSYLKRFPINSLKIDRSFVRDLTVDSDDAAIVSAIVSMAKSLRLHVVAEGVENQSQFDFLKDLQCDELQGYLISRPVESTVFTQFVKGWAPLH